MSKTQKPIGIFGLSKTGTSAMNFLKKKNIPFIIGDDSVKEIDGMQVTPISDPIWQEISELLLSPGVPLKFPAVHEIVKIANSHKIPITFDIEKFFLNSPGAKLIGVTGTNGKSTTTALIAHVLEVCLHQKIHFGGNIGIPVLSLPELQKNEIAVLELSSYQLDLAQKLKFHIAILLNLTPDHIERHGNFENYASAKEKIFQHQSEQDFAIISIDTESCRKIHANLLKNHKNIITFSTQQNADICFTGSILKCDKEERNLSFENLAGQHNAENIAATFAVTKIFNIPLNDAINAIASFKSLEHRMEKFLKKGKIEFINDSKATNMNSACHAIKAFQNIHLILGGAEKQEDLEEFTKFKNHINQAYLIGRSAEKFAQICSKHKIKFEISGTLENATKSAFKNASESDQEAKILLSPACASFDQFKNFEERGKIFKEICINL